MNLRSCYIKTCSKSVNLVLNQESRLEISQSNFNDPTMAATFSKKGFRRTVPLKALGEI